ncbi:MAG: uroporphyrinogen decarboxylase family protein [Lentisphaeria bacterium]|nr:uroporphyrinogen decarboxylase family protein [Lentisphaeria bacterium]
MSFVKADFIRSVLNSPRRRVVPIMTSPGEELIGVRPCELFRSGECQFRCIEALAAAAPVDAQVTLMDLSVEAEAFGCEIVFSDHANPTVAAPAAGTAEEIAALAVPGVGTGRTAEVLTCARMCASHLERPTFAGIIGPYSLAGRIADMTEMMVLAAAEPETAHALLRKVTDFLKQYAAALKATGVAGLMIAEPAAGLISPDMCQEFSSDYLKEIVAEVRDSSFMVILHNCGNTTKQVTAMLSTGADALHVGNAVDMTAILPQVPAPTLAMGNLDPVGVFRNMPPEQIYAATLDLLEKTAPYPNYVLSSGCDLPPGVPMSHIEAFLNALNHYNSRFEGER